MYRVAAIAAHFGYQVFLDDAKWNYGSWEDYFLDRDLDLNFDFGDEISLPGARAEPASARRCRPPRPGTKRAKLVLTADEVRTLSLPTPPSSSGDSRPAFVPRWATRPHVIWFARDMDALDLTYLRLFTNTTDLESLQPAAGSARLVREDIGEAPAPAPPLPYLTPEETLPDAFVEAFEAMSRVASRAWRVNAEIEREVASLAQRVGVDAESPTSVGTILDAGDLLIAVHVRCVL